MTETFSIGGAETPEKAKPFSFCEDMGGSVQSDSRVLLVNLGNCVPNGLFFHPLSLGVLQNHFQELRSKSVSQADTFSQTV